MIFRVYGWSNASEFAMKNLLEPSTLALRNLQLKHQKFKILVSMERGDKALQLWCWTTFLNQLGSRSNNCAKLTASHEFNLFTLHCRNFSQVFQLMITTLMHHISQMVGFLEMILYWSVVIIDMLFNIAFEPPKMVAWWRRYGLANMAKKTWFLLKHVEIF